MDKERDYLLIYIKKGYEDMDGFVVFFNTLFNIQYEQQFEMEKGTYGIITKKAPDSHEDENYYILVSSNQNMGLLNTTLNIDSLTNIILINDYDDNTFIYVDSSKNKSIIKYYGYTNPEYNIMSLNYITNSNLSNYLNKFGPDSLFMRTTSNHIDFILNNTFIFGLEEKYYLYNKIYFGKTNFYKYKHELDIFPDINKYIKPFFLYDNITDYEIINNKLIIVSGFQLFSFYNSYDSLFDLYFQKVNDLEHIKINPKMFLFNNLVKLFNEKKIYYLDFDVDHLIKLDKDFLDAEVTFTDINGTKYVLNRYNKIIKDLKGEGIKVTTNKLALVYFYQKIVKSSEMGIIEFQKSQIGKNMKFDIIYDRYNIKPISIAKDFCFKGYYPMISNESLISINSNEKKITIFVDNFYDKLDYELYEDEGEKYYIYIFNSENNNLPIF